MCCTKWLWTVQRPGVRKRCSDKREPLVNIIYTLSNVKVPPPRDHRGGKHTHHPVLVKDLDDDGGRFVLDLRHVAIHDDLVKDEHLVPGRAEGLVDYLGALTLVAEHHPGERVGQAGRVRPDQGPRLVHVGPQLEDLLLWKATT